MTDSELRKALTPKGIKVRIVQKAPRTRSELWGGATIDRYAREGAIGKTNGFHSRVKEALNVEFTKSRHFIHYKDIILVSDKENENPRPKHTFDPKELVI